MRPRDELKALNPGCGVGVVVDVYEDDLGVAHVEIHWVGTDRSWWNEYNLETVSESW